MTEHTFIQPRRIRTWRGMAYRRRLNAVLITVILAIGAMFAMAPFVFMVSTSFNAQAHLTVPFPPEIVPSELTFDEYVLAFSQLNLWQLYTNTTIVTVVSIVISVISAVLSGYALSKIQPRGGRVVLFIVLCTMMIPGETLLIPNFQTFSDLGLIDTWWPIWIPELAYPFGTFLTKQYFDSVPSELRDAAQIDGAGEVRTLISIYAPLAKGIIATMVILVFLSSWNSYLWPLLVINNPELYTIQLGLASFKQSIGADDYALPALTMAGTVLSLIPVLIIYIVFQRFIVQSVASSALKG